MVASPFSLLITSLLCYSVHTSNMQIQERMEACVKPKTKISQGIILFFSFIIKTSTLGIQHPNSQNPDKIPAVLFFW